MLFYYDENLKNNKIYLENETNKLIEYFNNIQDILSKKHKILLNCMENITLTIDNIQNTQDINDTNILFTMLDKIKSTFEALDLNEQKNKVLINKLKNIDSLLKKDLQESSVFSCIDELNSIYSTSKSEIKENESIIYDFLNYYISNSIFDFGIITPPIEENNKTIKSDNTEVNNNIDNTENIINEKPKKHELHDNNILLISEKDNLVYLPYKLDDIKDFFEKNKEDYSSLQDVINQKYIVSLNRFKNPVIARFREAFSLMKNKEKASLPRALDLALELSFNSLLNPAVICACKNLQELDIYLDYLETNELDKFTIFEVKYEVTPQALS